VVNISSSIKKGGGTMKINIIFHSIYGHIYRLVEAVAEVAGQVSGTQHGGMALRLWGGD
jgi:hypothetical protein